MLLLDSTGLGSCVTASNTHVGKVPKGKLRHCRDPREGAGSGLRSPTPCAGTPMELPVLQLQSPPGELMGLPLLPNVLAGESCAGPHGWCGTQLPRLSAAHRAAVKPSLVVPRFVQEGRADSLQGATGCRGGASRRNSSKGKGPALAGDRGEILNSPCKNKITMWSRLK